MFSRFKKPDASARPNPRSLRSQAQACRGARAPAAANGAPPALPPVRPMAGGPPLRPRRRPSTKDKKRKERMGELKVELHKRLLGQPQPAALEHATETDLKQEIIAIAPRRWKK